MHSVNLVFIRGDTAIVELANIKALDGSDYVLSDTDKVLLDIKKSEYSDDVLIHKEITKSDYQSDGGLIIKFYPDETHLLEKGEYLYDIKLYIDAYNKGKVGFTYLENESTTINVNCALKDVKINIA